MLKVGIQTIIGYNYGNRLQNYALQEVLRGLGCEVETLRDISDSCLMQRVKHAALYAVKRDFRENVKINRRHCEQLLRTVFSKWNKANIKFSRIKFSMYHCPSDLGQMYDYYIAGSDQIWNPYFRQDTLMLLSYAPPEKRISYAASFGITDFPKQFTESYQNELKKFKAVSVRESDGVNIVAEIAGVNAVRVIDPTMLLSIDEWRNVATRPTSLKDGAYILLYSLGGVPKKIRELAEKKAKEHGLAVYEILNEDNKIMNAVNPFEFVYLIDHAQFVITDSFHGTVFSILSKTPFIIFGRGDTEINMSSRFDTLLPLFKLENRIFSPSATYESVTNCDFSNVDDILAEERAAAKRFLTESLEL